MARHYLSFGTLLTVIFLYASLASGQTYGNMPNQAPRYMGINRTGLTLGMSIGGGFFYNKDAFGKGTPGIYEGIFTMSVRIGAGLSQRFIILYEGEFGLGSFRGSTLSMMDNVLALQFMITRAFWVKGGVGLAITELDSGGFATNRIGFGGLVSVGWEFFHGLNWVMDIHATILPMVYKRSEGGACFQVNGGIGFQWY